jgi:cytochrome c peroxidase
VAHSGTHDFSRINYQSLIQKLSEHPNRKTLAYDLTFLSGIRERIPVNGNGPRTLLACENRVILGNYFSDNLSIMDFSPSAESQHVFELMPPIDPDAVRLGEMYFHDASFCFQNWQSCTGCHPDDARTDGLNWDLLNDGLGNPKNCKSLVLSHETPPSMITGIRPDAETAVRAGFEFIQFMKVDEEISLAVDAYLRSLAPVASPYLVNGALNATAAQGKIIFERENCHSCHPAPSFTDQKLHQMDPAEEYGQQQAWDTPTLVESWRTGPYLHDGRCATMTEVFAEEKHGLEKELSQDELVQLVEYVLSL